MFNYIVGIITIVIAALVLFISLFEKRQIKHTMSFMEGFNLTGFPVVTLTNNDQKLNFVLDTGSVHSLINKSVVKTLSYDDAEYLVTISGIDNTLRKEEETIRMKLVYKDRVTEGMFVKTDLDNVFATVKRETGVQLHGLIGSDFFKENKYVIDYKEMIAYSKKI